MHSWVVRPGHTVTVNPSGTVHDSILDDLGRRIVDGDLPAGARMLSIDLAERFDSSRSAVREAVRVLESLGLVGVRRKAGIVVLPARAWNVYSPLVIGWRLAGAGRLQQLHELSQLRSAIEPLAARLAATAADDAQRAAITGAVHGMLTHSHEATGTAYLEADLLVHTTVLEASGNPMLASLREVVAAVLTGRTEHALMPTEANVEALRLHQAVAFAIARGDAEGAAIAMASIVSEADAAVQVLAG